MMARLEGPADVLRRTGVMGMSVVPLDLVEERIRSTLPGFPSIQGAYVFGSVLGDDPLVGDIDVGVIAPGISERDAERMEMQLEESLGCIDGVAFDVTVLDDRSVPFVMKVLREGRLVYAADMDIVTDFIERVSLAWRDIGPRYERARREVLEGVRAHGRRSRPH